MNITISGERTEMEWEDIESWDELIMAAALFYWVVEGANPDLDDPAIAAIFTRKFFDCVARSLVRAKTEGEEKEEE